MTRRLTLKCLAAWSTDFVPLSRFQNPSRETSGTRNSAAAESQKVSSFEWVAAKSCNFEMPDWARKTWASSCARENTWAVRKSAALMKINGATLSDRQNP